MKKVPLYLQTVLGMFLGILVGLYFGKEAEELGVVSKLLIEAIKNVAIPLLFFAILDAFVNSDLKGKSFFKMCALYALNAIFAITIALLISNLFEPGKYLPLRLSPQNLEKFTAHHSIPISDVPSLILEPTKFSKNIRSFSLFSGTTAAILLALMVGIALKLPLPQQIKTKVREGNAFALHWLFIVVKWLTHLIPIAVFCSVAKVVGTTGFSLAHGLLAYFVSCSMGMILHIALVYQSWIVLAGLKLKDFWKEAKEAVIYSFGINSSLATLPITLQTLKRLKISDSSARMAACVGTNFNNDGILLYEVVAALFMIQAYGQSLPLLEQLWLSVVCVIATIGIAGIPEAGMISLTLVLAAIGLPTEDLPVLLTVDWVLGRMRSVTNVIGDLSGAIVLDRIPNGARHRP